MKPKTNFRHVALLAGLPALIISAIAVQGVAHQDGSSAQPVQCEFVKHTSGGMLELTSRVTSDKAITGSYSLNMTQSHRGNHSSIQQSGDFSVPAHGSDVLGEVMVPAGGDYDVKLTLNFDGTRLVCRDGTGGTDL